MYNVVNRVKRSFAVFSALFITVITSKVRSHENCRPEELMKCSKPLSVLDSGLTFASSKADLDKICPDLHDAIKCIHTYSRHCMNKEHRRHFRKLFNGTVQMAEQLCGNETYQQEYLRHAPCMKRVEPVNEVCFKRYVRAMNEIQSNTPVQNVPETDFVSYQKKKREAADEGIRNVCCSFQEYVECSTHTTRRECGEDAAEFSKKFLDKMSSSMIQLHCTEYGHRECGLISSSNHLQTSSLTSLTSLVFVALLLLLR